MQKRAEAHAKQTEKLKAPGLADRQKQALNDREMKRFGVNATFVSAFADIEKNMVFPVILRYTNGYTPPNPTLRDIGQSISGGYPQQHIALVLVKATSDKVEAEFERPMFLSYTNGLNDSASHFMLCDDGTVQYFDDTWKQWFHHIPKWEFAKLPELPVMCSGFDV